MRSISIFSFLLGMFVLLFSSCAKDTLQKFPEVGNVDSSINFLRKPTGILVTGDYDQKLVIDWTNMQKEIKEIELRYIDDNQNQKLKITDFSKPLVLDMKFFKEYSLEFYAVDNGLFSNPSVIKTWTKESYLTTVMKQIQAFSIPGTTKLMFVNPLKEKIAYDFTYLGTGADSVHLTGDFSQEQFTKLISPIQGKQMSVTITMPDGEKAKRTFSVEYHSKSYAAASDKDSWTIYTDNPNTHATSYFLDRAFDGRVGQGATLSTYAFRTGTTGSTKNIRFSFTKQRVATSSKYDETSLMNPAGPFDEILPTALNISFQNNFVSNLNTITIIGIRADKSQVKLLENFDINYVKTSIELQAKIALPNLGPLIGLHVQFNNTSAATIAIHEINIDGFPF